MTIKETNTRNKIGVDLLKVKILNRLFCILICKDVKTILVFKIFCIDFKNGVDIYFYEY